MVNELHPSVLTVLTRFDLHSSLHADLSPLACDFARRRKLPDSITTRSITRVSANARERTSGECDDRRPASSRAGKGAAASGDSARDWTAGTARRIPRTESIDSRS